MSTLPDNEKRWLVVAVALVDVVAPVLRDFIVKEMPTHYSTLDGSPHKLSTLTHAQVKSDPDWKKLIPNFETINNNHLVAPGVPNRKSLFSYKICNAVELAKLYLPKHLACFSAFDDSLDLTAMLNILGYSPSSGPIFPMKAEADDVRKNVRNKWGHCNLKEWDQGFYDDCFKKLGALVTSLKLANADEKKILDQLKEWKTKGKIKHLVSVI